MGPFEITICIIVALAIIIVVGIIISNNNKKSRYLRLKDSFGTIINKEMTYEEYESISHYFKNTLKSDEFYIDDITWNDLDLDSIFLMINNTNSCVGRDYLYKLLRIPSFSREELNERERLIEFFDKNEPERTSMMMRFYDMGFTKKISISDYMDNLFKLKPGSNVIHYLLILGIIGSILFTFLVDAPAGVGLILASFGASIISYYRMKSRIDSYFECIRLLVGMVDCARHISSSNVEELSDYNAILKQNASVFKTVRRGSQFLTAGRKNSGSIADIVMEYVRFFTHIDLIKFNNMLRHIGQHKDEVYTLMNTLGYLESMISIASFRHTLPYYCVPSFKNEGGINSSNVYHLQLTKPQANSICEAKSVLITGSNASGKSTFLKSIGIAAILAQTINTCPADTYEAPFYRTYSSMALSDNLLDGESYYIVEIKSLKRIVDATHQDGAKVLCFIDEVLRGTNTVERIAASSEILRNIASSNAQCFAATHDIELTHILEDYYSNYHFTENVMDDNIVFSYIIQKGRATSKNAIKLLKIIGYDDEIINHSVDMADNFTESGVWNKI